MESHAYEEHGGGFLYRRGGNNPASASCSLLNGIKYRSASVIVQPIYYVMDMQQMLRKKCCTFHITIIAEFRCICQQAGIIKILRRSRISPRFNESFKDYPGYPYN
jgi:hypothetical protein